MHTLDDSRAVLSAAPSSISLENQSQIDSKLEFPVSEAVRDRLHLDILYMMSVCICRLSVESNQRKRIKPQLCMKLYVLKACGYL